MKMRALTVKSHGSYCPLLAVQRLQPFLRQLRAPRLWLRESHSFGPLPHRLVSISPQRGLGAFGCNLIIVPHSFHFRVQIFSILVTVGNIKTSFQFFPPPHFQGFFPPILSFSVLSLQVVLASAVRNRSARAARVTLKATLYFHAGSCNSRGGRGAT